MPSERAALAWCPFPDRESARKTAQQVLQEQLIACANIIPVIESVFIWRDELATEHETAVLFKTRAALLPALIARVGALHPYETPAILGWECDGTHPATLDWLSGNTAQNDIGGERT